MNYLPLIEQVASEERVDFDLLLAICTVESSLNPLAIRYEPAWRYFYFVREYADLLGLSIATETCLQSMSYGLPQVMGAVMREHKFEGNLMNAMVDPKLPLTYGAKHLRKFLSKYGDETDAISSYNQGSPRRTEGGLYLNQRYVDKVSENLRRLRQID